MAWLAGEAHGLVTRARLLEVGLSVGEIKHRLGTGALIREYRGVVSGRPPGAERRVTLPRSSARLR